MGELSTCSKCGSAHILIKNGRFVDLYICKDCGHGMVGDRKMSATMRVLEKNGVEYPRTERCKYCRSLVELDKDDTTITTQDYIENGPWVMGNFRQEYHHWTCPICESDNEFEGDNYEIY